MYLTSSINFNKKLIYIVSFDTKDKITIGRSQSSDLKISDVTISRIHSVLLRTKDNKILIKDACSKFGTLILLQSKKILINDKILSIQKGKVLFNIINLVICLINFLIVYFVVFVVIKRKKKIQTKIKKFHVLIITKKVQI